MSRLILSLAGAALASVLVIQMETGSFTNLAPPTDEKNYTVRGGKLVTASENSLQMSWDLFWNSLTKEEQERHESLSEEEKFALWQKKFAIVTGHKNEPQSTEEGDNHQDIPQEKLSNPELPLENEPASEGSGDNNQEAPAEEFNQQETPEAENQDDSSARAEEHQDSNGEGNQWEGESNQAVPAEEAQNEGSPEAGEPPSYSSPAFQECSATNRRALANRGGSEEEWKAMTECTINRDNNHKLGQFFQHISKAGGTSVISLLTKQGCFSDPLGGKKKNVAKDDARLGLGTDTNWINYERIKNYGFHIPFFAMMRPSKVWGASCSRVEKYVQEKNRVAIMSEAVIPFKATGEGLCDGFVNSIIVREPLRRIESHYRQLNIDCKKREFCESDFFVNGTNLQKYDSKFMSNAFDIVSDNYYTRSLVGNGYFQWSNDETTPSLKHHPEVWTKIFPVANASLHAFDWVIVLNSDQEDEGDNRDLIFQYGLGFGAKAKMGHKRTGGAAKESMLSDEEFLKEMNSLDYMLWESALELNRLDVLSLKRMLPYYDAALAASKAKKGRGEYCCGVTCRNFQQAAAEKGITLKY